MENREKRLNFAVQPFTLCLGTSLCQSSQVKLANLCYICGEQLIDIPSGYQGALLPKHRTKDHIPPQGIFNKPKPSNLITVFCCHECNGKHSDFDEQFRVLCSLELKANSGGQKIRLEKVMGSTMVNARQPAFMIKIHQTMREVEPMTARGSQGVAKFSVDRYPIEQGVINITKGLLTHFYRGFNYHDDKFVVLDIHSATLVAGQAEMQEKMIKELETKTQGEVLGSEREFQFWRKVESERQHGVWLLRFYGAMNFIVLHYPPSESYGPV